MQAQFIRGLLDSNIRVKLLEMKSETTFDETVNMALALEAAKKQNNEEFDQNKSSEVSDTSNVNRVSRVDRKQFSHKPNYRNDRQKSRSRYYNPQQKRPRR